MPIQMKIILDLDIEGLVVDVEAENGARSGPTIVDRELIARRIAEAIHRVRMCGEYGGLDASKLTFALPVELHLLLRYTCFSETMDLSVLDAIAQRACVGVDRIVAEYPTAERAEATINLITALRDRAMQFAERWQDKYAAERLEHAATKGWMKTVSEDMRKAIVEAGIEDRGPDDGDQQPNVSTRLEVLVAELRRLRALTSTQAKVMARRARL